MRDLAKHSAAFGKPLHQPFVDIIAIENNKSNKLQGTSFIGSCVNMKIMLSSNRFLFQYKKLFHSWVAIFFW